MSVSEKKVQQALQFLRHDAFHLLDQLQADTKPVWGRMTPQHMLEHLIWALNGSSGEKIGKISNAPLAKNLRPVWKTFVLSTLRLPMNVSISKTKTDLLPLKYESFEAAKQQLKQTVENAVQIFISQPEKRNNHPFAGSFKSKEWLVFHRKHFIHHFTQFGLLKKKMFV